jgi:hypothetical protein
MDKIAPTHANKVDRDHTVLKAAVREATVEVQLAQ